MEKGRIVSCTRFSIVCGLVTLLCACGGSSGSFVPDTKAAGSDSGSTTSGGGSTTSGGGSTGGGTNPPPTTNPCVTMKVVAYFPSWQGNVIDIQFSKLTHIHYAFLLPNPDGSFQAIENAAKLQELVSAAAGYGVKVGISIGGWNDGDDSAFVALAADSAARANFVTNVINFVNTYGLDGVDIDWEYPYGASESADFAALMSALAAQLHANGKYLSAAVIAEGSVADAISDSVLNDIDFLNIMAYDLNNRDHSPYSYAVTAVDYWQQRSLPREKAVLGVPFYARPSEADYKDKVAEDSANACRDTDGREYWNGIPTIRMKAELTKSDVCGIMMWEISEDTTDDTSLLTALREVIDNDPPSYSCN